MLHASVIEGSVNSKPQSFRRGFSVGTERSSSSWNRSKRSEITTEGPDEHVSPEGDGDRVDVVESVNDRHGEHVKYYN